MKKISNFVIIYKNYFWINKGKITITFIYYNIIILYHNIITIKSYYSCNKKLLYMYIYINIFFWIRITGCKKTNYILSAPWSSKKVGDRYYRIYICYHIHRLCQRTLFFLHTTFVTSKLWVHYHVAGIHTYNRLYYIYLFLKWAVS